MINATHMRQEIEEIPSAVARLLAGSHDRLAEAGDLLRRRNPNTVVTIARGSSDHAATFLKYAIELSAGVPVASIGPSVASIYGQHLRLKHCAAISISQSGKSPDIVAMAEAARRDGATTFAITNTPASPLAAASDVTVDLLAGEEKSVAATKTFVASVVAGLGIVAHWQQDQGLLAALDALPQVLTEAIACDWSPLLGALDKHQSLYVLGRGPAFAIANEAALKFKETCGIHAIPIAPLRSSTARLASSSIIFRCWCSPPAMRPRPRWPRSPSGWPGRAPASSSPRSMPRAPNACRLRRLATPSPTPWR